MDNQHEWKLGYTDSGDNSDKHCPLWEENDKGWLKAGSPVRDALVAIDLDKRFIKQDSLLLKLRYSFFKV